MAWLVGIEDAGALGAWQVGGRMLGIYTHTQSYRYNGVRQDISLATILGILPPTFTPLTFTHLHATESRWYSLLYPGKNLPLKGGIKRKTVDVERISDDVERALERFVYDNPDLERLEAILDDFNPFQAMRWTRQEVRHSAFLRWLLDPQETHGLGSYFLRAFIKRIAHRSIGLHPMVPSVFEVDSWDLSHTEVLQEWSNIDLLIKDDFDKFVLVLENKVDSREHSGQLQRYRSLVERQFPSHKKLYVYLTIGGAKASDEYYISVNYSEIVALVTETLTRRGDQLNTEVRTFLSQYVEMVRRSIVEDSEIQRICQRIYEKHRRALDVIFEYRPDKASEVTEMLKELISKYDGLEEDHCTKAYIRFIPKELDFLPRASDGWTPSKRILLFEIENYRSKISCGLILGPGSQELRNQIYELVRQHPDVFNRATYKFYPQYWSLHRESWVGTKRYEELSLPDLREVVSKRLDSLLNEKLPGMIQALAPLKGTDSN